MQILPLITAKAVSASVPFLMIGGHAVVAYGYPRHTADLDLLVREEDRAFWQRVCLEIGYVTYHDHPNFLMYNSGHGSASPLDLMLVDSSTFHKLATDSGVTCIEGQAVKIPSLPHLIALKLHALRNGQVLREERDLSDVVTLLQLHGVKLASEPYQEIFNRYATAGIRAEVERRMARLESPSPGRGSSGPA